jgi:general secretion pathway protein K
MRLHQQGVAIVLAMGVVALATLTATGMMVSQSTWIRQVELGNGHVQAQHLIQAGLDWTRALLGDDRNVSITDHLGEAWALRLPPVPVNNGSLAGHIEDEQGKFNLNNLLKDGKINLTQLERFRNLLIILDMPPALAGTLADWLDADNEPQALGGAEDAYYLSLQSPYRAANRALVDVAELALVRGFNDEARARLRGFVTALPGFTAVNVNTASPEVIAAIIDGLNLDDARALVAQRERVYFRDAADFFSRLPPELIVANDDVSVNSGYFLATMLVNISGTQARGTALLARASNGWPTVIWRKYP